MPGPCAWLRDLQGLSSDRPHAGNTFHRWNPPKNTEGAWLLRAWSAEAPETASILHKVVVEAGLDPVSQGSHSELLKVQLIRIL
jgi:hypothetical protein